jgi:hypothetical protein
MGKIATYQKAIYEVMDSFKAYFEKTSKNIRPLILADEKNQQYQFAWAGWSGTKRLFNIAFHLSIENDKIWIQVDNTEEGIATLLVEKGINPSDVVLGYFPEEHRKYTEFAVA